MISNFDREEIIRTWSIFRQPGEVTELRILNAGWNKTISGYFDDPKKFADSVVGLADEPFPAYYFVINPVSSELMARAANRYIKKAKNTTADKDIVALHWLPVDIDPQRPAGMSSTDAEHNAAITKAREIRGWLQERGWPGGAFVLADSGNGAHLSVRIELPNDRPSRALVKRCLEALHTKFSDKIAHVDTTTHNPARIWKIYGTMARKGSSTATRPHRLAHILELPESLEVVPGALLEALGGTAATPDPEKKKKATATKRAGVKRWNLAEVNAFVEPHGIHVLGEPKIGMDWTVFELDQCPFNPEHNRGEACLSVNNQSGIIAFKCQHDSCKDKKIEDLYELWITEPLSSISGNVFQEFTRDEFVDGKGEDENGEPISEHFSPTKAAAAILSRVDLRIASWEVNNREKEPDIWSCGDNGIWSRDGEQFIDEICDIMAEDLSTKWTLQETKRRIRNAIRGEPAEFDTGTPNLVGTKNGSCMWGAEKR